MSSDKDSQEVKESPSRGTREDKKPKRKIAAPILRDQDEEWPIVRRDEAIRMALVAALSDEDVEVIGAAVDVLGEIAAKEARTPLTTLALKKKVQRKRLANVNVEAALDRISQAQKEGATHQPKPDPWRYRDVPAYDVLDFESESEDAGQIALLIETLNSAPDSVSMDCSPSEAAEMLGKIGHHAAVPILIELVASRDLVLRAAVLRTLGQIGHCSALDRVNDLAKDVHEAIRASIHFAQESLARKAKTAQIWMNTLSDGAKLKTSQFTEKEIVEQLGDFGAEEAIPVLAKKLSTDDKDIRLAAIKAMERIGGSSALPHLAKVAKDTNESKQMRCAAIKAIGYVKAKEAVPMLVEILKERDDEITPEAIKAFGNIRETRGLPAFAKAIVQGKLVFPGERNAHLVEKALNKIGEDEAINALRPYLDSPDDSIRSKAISALGYVIGKKSVIILINALEDDSPLVRKSAVESLRSQISYEVKFGGKTSLPKAKLV